VIKENPLPRNGKQNKEPDEKPTFQGARSGGPWVVKSIGKSTKKRKVVTGIPSR
jgi:hypothetical protein